MGIYAWKNGAAIRIRYICHPGESLEFHCNSGQRGKPVTSNGMDQIGGSIECQREDY